MANSPLIAKIAEEIAGVSVTVEGQDLKVFGLAESGQFDDFGRSAPCMFPNAEGFVTDFQATRIGLGSAGATSYQYHYRLQYSVAIAPLGAERGLNESMPSLAAWAAGIVGAVAGADDTFSAQEMRALPVDKFVLIKDGLGQAYIGFNLAFEVEDYS